MRRLKMGEAKRCSLFVDYPENHTQADIMNDEVFFAELARLGYNVSWEELDELSALADTDWSRYEFRASFLDGLMTFERWHATKDPIEQRRLMAGLKLRSYGSTAGSA